MKYRIEKKYVFKKKQMSSVLNYLNRYNIRKLYPERYIHSLYFDNKKLDLFHKSIEGIIPRKKVRLRKYYYNNNFKNFLTNTNLKIFEDSIYEEKISDYYGRKKFSMKNSRKNIVENGFYLQKIGFVYPVVEVYYKRSYFTFKDYRITMDENISYKNSSKLFQYKDDVILEFKFNPKNINDFDLIIPFREKTSSKYCHAINYCLFDGKIF